MSIQNETTIDLFDLLSTQMNRYFTLIVFCFGVIGNILNIMILSQRTLRSNSCAWLFLISSVANLISIVCGLLTRMKSGWDFDFTETIAWLCQLRAFIVFTSRTIALWLIALASIDRWLLSSTNANYRRKSSLKNVQKLVIIITILSILFYGQIFFCYDANLTTTPLRCYGKTIECRYLADITYIIITILSPLITMLLFGLMTISNIRQSQRRIHNLSIEVLSQNHVRTSSDNQQKRTKKKVDHHLFHMLLIQIILLTILTLPQAIQKIYSTITDDTSFINDINQAMNNFIYSCAVLLSFLASGMPFYIYTLFGGDIFRKALYKLLQTIVTKISCIKE
ncbi:hypothetical protein I4U23_020399 [Adineta vaga]|nr:hypothetical protein I4U23_020399 [Adineta vaga]